MGGFGSGRQYGAPLVDECLRVDLPWMLRNGRAVPGHYRSGTLSWTCGGELSGSISYQANMIDPDNAWAVLTYTRGTGEDAEQVRQEIRLTYTKPNYGGRRWWMICPYQGHRVSILYKPWNGDRFASRKAWGVGYKSQRITERDRPFEMLFKLQKKLGGPEGWEAGLARRPKGMWHRTYQQHRQEYWRLDKLCGIQMGIVVGRLHARIRSLK